VSQNSAKSPGSYYDGAPMTRLVFAARKVAQVGMLLFGLSACQRSASTPDLGAHTAPAAKPSATVKLRMSRQEGVAHAAMLAAKGASTRGAVGARLLNEAAALRVYWWRREHNNADALEALDLYRQAAERTWNGTCDARVERALLEAELQADPALATRTLQSIRAEADPRCRDRIALLLAKLGAFHTPAKTSEPSSNQVLGSNGQASNLPPAPALGGSSTLAAITQIHRYGAKDAARIVVELSQPVSFEVGSVRGESGGEGPRVFVDILRAEYRGEPSFEVGGVVRRLRIGNRAQGIRLVLDLESEVYQKVFYLPEPFRLIIDVATRAPKRALGVDGQRPIRRVVLDPGHGGHDPGAIGPSGLREKDVTLDIARRAAPLIAEELGIATLLTRDSDLYVPLDERAAKANAFNADVFVSIHCNATDDGHGDGVMTFVLDSSKDAFAQRIAARENSASAAAASELGTAMSADLDTEVVGLSARFASLLQRATITSLEPSYGKVLDHGVKRAGFYVLAGAHMPAVLFEASFISNPAGETHLNTADYRQKLADGIVNAIRAFKDGR